MSTFITAPYMAVTALALSSAVSAAPVQSSDSISHRNMPLERLFQSPALSGASMKSLAYSPDGKRVTYLKGKASDANRLDLWQYDLASGQHQLLLDSDNLFQGPENLSDEEKARRERLRLFASGIVSYSWSKDGNAMIFPLNGDLYYFDVVNNKTRKLTDTAEFETDAKISPKGGYVSFIREQDIFVIDLDSGKETQLTRDGEGTIKNGMAEFVAQEEMDRMTGYWWAPDDSAIAFTQFDDKNVEEVVRNEIYADGIKLYNQRYPAAGKANVSIKLGVVNIKNPAPRFVSTKDDADSYLPRVQWGADASVLTYQWQSRDQQRLELRKVALDNLASQTLITEQSQTWINLHNDLHFLKKQPQFIWASERDGFKHLYLYDLNGKLIRQLTKGNWIVNAVHAIDEAKGVVLFSGRKDTPLENHLYQLELGSGTITRLTEAGYFHDVVVADNASGFIDTFSNVSTPNKVALRDRQGKLVTLLEANAVDTQHPLHAYKDRLITPTFGTLTADDGQQLHYRMFAPKTIKPGHKYPAIVAVYGGPHAQRVVNSWSGRDLYYHYLANRGYVVFQLDNRGSANRGVAFEAPIYKKLAEVEIADQITGVKYLRSLPFVDAKRIGVFGHSYGGYMAIMAMFKAGDYFAAGVSGAPVTDWALYDTHYTERYLGHPAQNAKGYTDSAVFPYADGLKGPLLIYHGMADDNVLFSHSTQLFALLQQKGKVFDVMTYPGSKHALFGEEVQIHLHRTITQFFDRTLLAPPTLPPL